VAGAASLHLLLVAVGCLLVLGGLFTPSLTHNGWIDDWELPFCD